MIISFAATCMYTYKNNNNNNQVLRFIMPFMKDGVPIYQAVIEKRSFFLINLIKLDVAFFKHTSNPYF